MDKLDHITAREIEALELLEAKCRLSGWTWLGKAERDACITIREAISAPQGTARSQEAGLSFADKLKAAGYAPGGYAIVCRQCRRFAGGCDKLATRCQPCAIQALGSQGKGGEAGTGAPGVREVGPEQGKPCRHCGDGPEKHWSVQYLCRYRHGETAYNPVEADNQAPRGQEAVREVLGRILRDGESGGYMRFIQEEYKAVGGVIEDEDEDQKGGS